MKQKISELFGNCSVNAVLLRNSSSAVEHNFYYFSRLPFGHYSNSFLILKKNRKPLLLTTGLDSTRLSGISVKRFSSKGGIEKILKKELGKTKNIGLNLNLYPQNSFSALKKILKKKRFVDVSKDLVKTRETKTGEELEKIKKAVKISEMAAEKIPNFFRKGITEKQLALKLEEILREKGDNSLAFPTIVASAKNSAVPHHITSNAKIKKGFLLVDFGAKYKNYCADLTRMFFVGKPEKKHKALYETVFQSKQISQELIRPGTPCKNVFEQADKFLKKHAKQSLVHSLGHGLGLEVHDFPYGFRQKSNDVLKPGMVLTIEPAVYRKSFGIRIEDDILVTKNGCRLLSSAPEHLVKI